MRKDPQNLQELKEQIRSSSLSPRFIRIAKRARTHGDARGAASRFAYQEKLPESQVTACCHLFTVKKEYGKKVFNKVIRELRANTVA